MGMGLVLCWMMCDMILMFSNDLSLCVIVGCFVMLLGDVLCRLLMSVVSN